MPAPRLKIDIDAMQAQATKATSLLGAMCNEKRLMILCQLIDGERSVNELAELLETVVDRGARVFRASARR